MTNSFVEYNRKNIIANSLSLEQNEKEIVKEQESLFENANQLSSLSGENRLQNYSFEIERKRKSKLNVIFIFLIIFLISSEYTSENCLIIFIFDNNYIIFFFNFFSYFISFILQRFLLKKISENNYNRKILIILSILAIIFQSILSYIFFSKYNEINNTIFFIIIIVSNSIMIVISDFFRILTVNLFIELLPIEKFKFLCIKGSFLIIFFNKIIRLIPGTLICIFYNIDTKYFSFNFATSSLLFLISFIILLLIPRLNLNSLTRILNNSI